MTITRMGFFTGILLLAAAPAAPAQTPTSAPATQPSGGAYAALSPGNQKIAQALFSAQATTPTTTGTAAKPLTLDQIAAMKAGGQGWGQVFHQMKSEGLVQDKNLGQTISRSNHATHLAGSTHPTIVTTASGHSAAVGAAPGHAEIEAREAGREHGFAHEAEHGGRWHGEGGSHGGEVSHGGGHGGHH